LVELSFIIYNGLLRITLGGALAQYASWRWAFWLNLPLAALAMAITYWVLPLKSVHGDVRTKLKQVDYMGSFLTIAAAVLILVR
jgi:predicted MFS family arabinose efflux permease